MWDPCTYFLCSGCSSSSSMNHNWRQVRIFTSDFTEQWYLGLLTTFAVPFAAKYPETPFWFTRYTGKRTHPSDDIADTEIGSLSSPYLDAAQSHLSLRFRFSPSSDEKTFLESLSTSRFWYSGFLPFNAFQQFSSGRFCADPETAKRLKRADAVARLLHANCLFTLNMLQQHNDAWRFEPNADSANFAVGNAFQTMIHLMTQITGKNAHEPLPLFWQDPNTPQNFIPAAIT